MDELSRGEGRMDDVAVWDGLRSVLMFFRREKVVDLKVLNVTAV